MNTRDFLKTCLGGGLLTSALPTFITPKCPNCGAGLVGSTCLYCKSPVVGVYPDDIVVFNTPEMEAPEGFDQYRESMLISQSVSETLRQLQARFTTVSACWMGHRTGFFRVEIVRMKDPYSYWPISYS